MQYVDTHTHVISQETERYPLQPLGGKQSKWSREHPATVEELVAEMDNVGTKKAAVVHASTAYGFDNSYAADSVDKYPDRLYGVCSVDFMGEKNKEDLAHWVEDRGFIGCRLYTAGILPEQQDWLDDPHTHRAWAYAQESRIPVAVALRPSAFPLIESLLNRFPELIMILDSAGHGNLEGGPPYEKSADLFALARYENLYLKVISTTFNRAAKFPGGSPGMMRSLIDNFGENRIAWGSDFPAAPGTMSELVQLALDATSELSENEREAIFVKSAQRIYPSLA